MYYGETEISTYKPSKDELKPNGYWSTCMQCGKLADQAHECKKPKTFAQRHKSHA